MNTNNAINAYKAVGLESAVASSDPLKLIVMLYQGALLAIASAKNQMLRNEIEAKSVSISKAISIIDEGLNSCLDMNAGGEIAQHLSALYSYMCQRLLIAHVKNDPAILDEIAHLLSELKGAWEVIAPGAASSAANLSPASNPAGTGMTNSVPQSTTAKQAALMYGRM
jgi:flagellar protein FliS